MPPVGFCSTTQWAVEGLHDSLAREVAGFGIKVTLIEPGAHATDFAVIEPPTAPDGMSARCGW